MCSLAILKAKNKRLERELNLSRIRAKKLENELSQKLLIHSNIKQKSAHIEDFKGFFAYKLALLKSTEFYGRAERIFTYSRRSLLAVRISKYAAVAIAFIETSAVLVIFSGAILVLVPILFSTVIALAFLNMFSGKKYERLIREMTLTKRTVIIVSKSARKADVFAREMLARSHAVIIVTSSLKDGFFISAKIKGGVILVREAYFFKLKLDDAIIVH